MKLTSETLNILKNFSTINSGILFKQGNKLSTVSPTKTILAEVELTEEFPQEFGVYDLNQFLMILNNYKNDVELEFDSVNVLIKSGKNKIKYRMTDKNMIVIPPEKSLTLPSVDVAFTLTEQDLNNILKTAGILQSPNIAIESNGENVFVTSFDASNDSAHVNTVELEVNGTGNVYKMVFKTDNLKMIPGEYEVKISSRGISNFKNTKTNLQYWIAIEAGISKFEG